MLKEEKNEIKEEENEVIETNTDSVLEDESGELVEDEVTGDTLTPSQDEEESGESNEENIVEDGDGAVEVKEPEPEPEPEPAEKMLTQSQVNELVGRARQEGRDSAMRELLERYGVGSDAELNDVFGKGQIYDDLNDEFTHQGNSYKSVMAENALLKTHISPDRWEDVKLILGGKGLEVNAENIEGMIATHPEWRSAEGDNKLLTPEMAEDMLKHSGENKVVKEHATIRKLGNEPSPEKQISEQEVVDRLFGFDKK